MGVMRNSQRAVRTGQGRSGRHADASEQTDAAVKSLTFGTVCIHAREKKLPLSSFESLWRGGVAEMAAYLAFSDAARLMLVDTGTLLSLHGHPLLRLDEIARAFVLLADNNRKLEARRLHPGTSRDLRPATEEIVFHFASERNKGPRKAPAPAERTKSRTDLQARIHAAIRAGDCVLLRAGLRELLADGFMKRSEKLEWLAQGNSRGLAQFCGPREPGELAPPLLESFGQHPLGALEKEVRMQLEAIYAYVDELVSTSSLSRDEKLEICVKPGNEDIVSFCLERENPAVAASVLLGIHESSAGGEIKSYLLNSVGEEPGGVMVQLDQTISSMEKYAWPGDNFEWVGQLVDRLKQMKQALVPVESSGCPEG